MKKEHLVRCTVSDCIHYEDSCCTASGIQVDGEDAKKSTHTCCDTFSESGSFTNSVTPSHNKGCTQIDCKVKECRYNDDCKCSLDSIEVKCTCDPCTCGSESETCCSSFSL